MPPKPKFTKAEIIEAAFELVRENGLDAVAAREVGKKLNTSSTPIFTAFKNMDELKTEVIKEIKKKFVEHIRVAFDYVPAFKKVGMQWFDFAMNEPNLYSALFLSQKTEFKDLHNLVMEIDETLELTLDSIQNQFDLLREEALNLYKQMILHANGIASFCANGSFVTSEEEVNRIYGEICFGLVMYMKTRRGVYDPNALECKADPMQKPVFIKGMKNSI